MIDNIKLGFWVVVKTFFLFYKNLFFKAARFCQFCEEQAYFRELDIIETCKTCGLHVCEHK